ncbi:MAG TPA: DNA-formamidopyrimidine glycosylase family protein [Acidimicrobiales bacterium]|nr:DNA-formamidopyrimidine glycosylase family protein [Acidimicrobiales bacterium]
MPELPDVEGFRSLFAARAAGRRVVDVEVLDAGVVRNTTPASLRRSLRGRRFDQPERRGKWLVAPTGDGGTAEATVLFHFGMTGLLSWADGAGDRHTHDRVVFVTEDGELRYRDQRKLRGLWLARGPDEVDAVIGRQGPDALGLGRRQLGERLSARRAGLKSALMNQSVVAGLGNLVVDEVLWQARVHPARRWTDLDRVERDRLSRALQRVLRASVRQGRVSTRSDWLTGRRDEPDPRCPRCGRSLRRSQIGGRSTWWCPACQPPGGDPSSRSSGRRASTPGAGGR